MSDRSLQPLTLPPPVGGRVDLLVVAAEHSGDAHAARMVAAVRAARPELVVCALGGPQLAAAGAQLLRDLTLGSTMGFAVLAKLSFYRALIAEIVRWVGVHRPRAVCFVDSSGLNLRIARGLFERGLSTKAGGRTKALYYISPQIWASRSGRRFEMARHLDALAAIFPFEPAVYADTALPVTFVGHPLAAPHHRLPVAFAADGPVLLLPGSRRQVVKRLFPVLLEAFGRVAGERPAIALFPSEEMRVLLERLRAGSRVAGRVELRPVGGTTVGAAAVLTASGTMSLECALAGIPGALAYQTDWLTYWLGRMIVKVDQIGIGNLLLQEAMYPEYIQGAATPDRLAAELEDCLHNTARAGRTAEQAARLRAALSQQAESSVGGWMIQHLA